MIKEDFETILSKLQERVTLCKKYLGCLEEQNDLNELSVRQVRELKEFCDSELKIQTRILMVDLYHVIGMGNLTVSQTGAFLKIIKEYSDYRPIIKTVNKMDLDFNNMFKIETNPVFKLLELGITVYGKGSDGRVVEEEIETVEMYKEMLDDSGENSSGEEIPEFWPVGTYDATTNRIKIELRDIPKMAKFLIANVKSFKNLTESNIRKAMIDGKDFGGIQWVNSSDGYRIGIANQSLKEALKELFH